MAAMDLDYQVLFSDNGVGHNSISAVGDIASDLRFRSGSQE